MNLMLEFTSIYTCLLPIFTFYLETQNKSA